MNKRNYQKELDRTLEGLSGAERVPKLLLHSCCAPCSSYVLEYLAKYFRITVFYYNPNIYPPEEFDMRAAEQERLIAEMNADIDRFGAERDLEADPGQDPEKSPDQAPGQDPERSPERTGKATGYPICFVRGDYHPETYYGAVKGLESEPEGGERCTECFRLRLTEAARQAKEGGFDYFTTTLSISPLKDAERLNRLGEEAGERYGVKFLNSDFKKRNGYQRSIELSREHGLYRQNYCGCVFSRTEEPATAQPG